MQMVCNLREFKEFIDNEMIVILGQMDSPTQIFDHVFLVSLTVNSRVNTPQLSSVLKGALKETVAHPGVVHSRARPRTLVLLNRSSLASWLH